MNLVAKKTKTDSVDTTPLYAHPSSSLKKGTPKTLKTVFEDCLNDTYGAEKQIFDILPELAKAADNEELQDTFEHHLAQNQRHIIRLEKVFTYLEMQQSDEPCKPMEGLITACKKIIDEHKLGPVRDSALITGAQKIAHYEIAAYGSLCELAEVLGYEKVCTILDRTLEDEEEADRLLADIAKEVNEEAVVVGEEDERDEDEIDEEDDDENDEFDDERDVEK